jgi:hypothetical protein
VPQHLLGQLRYQKERLNGTCTVHPQPTGQHESVSAVHCNAMCAILAGHGWLLSPVACSAMWAPWRRASQQRQEEARRAPLLLLLRPPLWTESCARSAAAAGAGPQKRQWRQQQWLRGRLGKAPRGVGGARAARQLHRWQRLRRMPRCRGWQSSWRVGLEQWMGCEAFSWQVQGGRSRLAPCQFTGMCCTTTLGGQEGTLKGPVMSHASRLLAQQRVQACTVSAKPAAGCSWWCGKQAWSPGQALLCCLLGPGACSAPP